MRLTILLMAACAAWAQPPFKAVSNPTNSERPLLSLSAMKDLENHLDEKVTMAATSDPMLLLGETRSLYLPGYGTVITQEVSLVAGPMISPFKTQISPAEVAQTHQRKVARLPLLKKTMQQMWVDTAGALSMVPDNEQIIIAVRLLYKPWEDTKGLPGQILLKGTRGGGPAAVQMEEQ